jgi:hypothetical protein
MLSRAPEIGRSAEPAPLLEPSVDLDDQVDGVRGLIDRRTPSSDGPGQDREILTGVRADIQVATVVRVTPFSAKSIPQLLETSLGDHS